MPSPARTGTKRRHNVPVRSNDPVANARRAAFMNKLVSRAANTRAIEKTWKNARKAVRKGLTFKRSRNRA